MTRPRRGKQRGALAAYRRSVHSMTVKDELHEPVDQLNAEVAGDDVRGAA